MKLADVKDRIETADVLLVENPSLFGRLIRLRTLSRFSHVGFATRVSFGGRARLSIFEAQEGCGVQVLPLDLYLANLTRRGGKMHWFKLDHSVCRDKIGEFLHEAWGKRYASVWQFLVSFAWLLCRRPRDLDPDRFFCSELVTAALEAGGWKPEDDCLPAATAPEQVALFPVLRRMGTLEL